MATRPRLALIVISRNEEELIADCLRSASLCDEMVVVDSFSTDRTVEIALLPRGAGVSAGVSGLHRAKAVRPGAGHCRLGPESGRGRATHPWIAPGNRRRYRLARNPADGYEIRRDPLPSRPLLLARDPYPDLPSAPVPARGCGIRRHRAACQGGNQRKGAAVARADAAFQLRGCRRPHRDDEPFDHPVGGAKRTTRF